jgi:hypothetical protein
MIDFGEKTPISSSLPKKEETGNSSKSNIYCSSYAIQEIIYNFQIVLKGFNTSDKYRKSSQAIY